jgi:hypothetical protein
MTNEPKMAPQAPAGANDQPNKEAADQKSTPQPIVEPAKHPEQTKPDETKKV